MPMYDFACPNCESEFEAYKPLDEWDLEQRCPDCDHVGIKLLSAAHVAPIEMPEYNPGLGCVVRDKKHRAELCKRKNLIEVGNESKDLIHKESNANKKKKLSWEGV